VVVVWMVWTKERNRRFFYMFSRLQFCVWSPDMSLLQFLQFLQFLVGRPA